MPARGEECGDDKLERLGDELGGMHKHDAVALVDLVRAREVAPKELLAQAAEAVARIDPQIEAVPRAFTKT